MWSLRNEDTYLLPLLPPQGFGCFIIYLAFGTTTDTNISKHDRKIGIKIEFEKFLKVNIQMETCDFSYFKTLINNIKGNFE